MTIYPDRRKGKLTGRFVVETRVAGKRVRARVATMAEALEFERNPVAPTKTEAAPVTLEALVSLAAPAIWGRTTILEAARAAVLRAATLIGPHRLATLSTRDVDRVIEGLRLAGLEPATINRNLSALRRILKWSRDRGWGPRVLPSFEWQAEPEQTLRLLHTAEDTRVLEALEAQGDSTGAEVADFVRAMLATGLRNTELLRRTPEDLFVTQVDGQEQWWLRVTKTKTKQERAVPLAPETLEVLRRRLPWRIYQHNVRDRWDRARAALGLTGDRRFVPYALRHTFGTQWARKGGSAYALQRVMGHADIKTTLKYVHIADQDVAAAFKTVSGR